MDLLLMMQSGSIATVTIDDFTLKFVKAWNQPVSWAKNQIKRIYCSIFTFFYYIYIYKPIYLLWTSNVLKPNRNRKGGLFLYVHPILTTFELFKGGRKRYEKENTMTTFIFSFWSKLSLCPAFFLLFHSHLLNYELTDIQNCSANDKSVDSPFSSRPLLGKHWYF